MSDDTSPSTIEVGDIQGSVGVAIDPNVRATVVGYTAEQVSALLMHLSTQFQPKPFEGRCPYKVLDVFTEDDADLFFGREWLVAELAGRVKEARFVLIGGPSGSGKSSLARAGLLRALKNGALPNSDRWLYATLKPGRDPLEQLALALSRAVKSPLVADYMQQHAAEPEALNKCVESLTDNRPAPIHPSARAASHGKEVAVIDAHWVQRYAGSRA